MKREHISIWYSVPSVVVLMMDHGGLLLSPAPHLRTPLFAGEVFPPNRLRDLRENMPGLGLLNLYGPTETNVCTCYEVDRTHAGWKSAVPIGRACSGDTVWAEAESGLVCEPGQEGELMVAGPTVMLGYWGLERGTGKPFATGDIVRVLPDGSFQFLGRHDHLVKVRGHRIEPEDIEQALQEHPDIREAAVIVSGAAMEARLVAFIVSGPDEAPSLLKIKEHCARRLPHYMIVDQVRYLDALPRTRNGKLDRSGLAGLLTGLTRDAAHA